MIIFIATYLLIYGSIHFYFFSKVRGAFTLSPTARLALLLFLALMVLAPIIIHWLERYNLLGFARVAAYFGYVWMAFLFLFFSLSVAHDAYRLIIHIAGLISSADLSRFILSPKWRFIVPACYATIVTIYGFFEANAIRTERITIHSPKIPSEIGTIRIAQISDVHLGLTVCEGKLKKIISIISRENPDILVATGDLVDGDLSAKDCYSPFFEEVQPKYGKYAITGNHEFYAGIDKSVEFMERAGFRVLRNEAVEVNGFLNIVGVDDPTAKQMGFRHEFSEVDLLTNVDSDRFTLLLKHQPRVNEKSIGLFDLMLSGHTHKGQMFPFNLITRLFFTANAGYLDLGKGSSLYVSRGTGTWGPPIRFLAPPEVTIIEISAE